jgi:hypothetical protein
MNLRSASYAFGILIFAVILVLWASGGPKSVALAQPQQGGTPAPTSTVLVVSNESPDELQVFLLPGLQTPAPPITGLSQPQGLCSGAKGSIWVANYGTRQMLQYSSSGTPVKAIHDKHGYPFACSVDGESLAIANIQNVSPPPDPEPCASPMSGPGETVVTNINGMGAQPSYDTQQLYCVDGVAYDPSSPDLYITGVNEAQTFVLGELPAGSSQISLIPIISGPTVHVPGMLQFDNGTLFMGDRRCGTPTTTCVYSVSISNSGATIANALTQPLKASNGHVICDMAQGVIGGSGAGRYLAGGDDESSCNHAGGNSSVYRWKFPDGGMPTNSYSDSNFKHPFGTAIGQ